MVGLIRTVRSMRDLTKWVSVLLELQEALWQLHLVLQKHLLIIRSTGQCSGGAHLQESTEKWYFLLKGKTVVFWDLLHQVPWAV